MIRISPPNLADDAVEMLIMFPLEETQSQPAHCQLGHLGQRGGDWN